MRGLFPLKSDKLSNWVGLYWPLLLPVIFYLPALGGYAFPSAEGAFSDLAVTHHPYLVFFKRAILEFGQWPLWNPQIMSGAPFAANPLAGVWYPPGWVALFFPTPFGINLLVLVHVVWGTLGFFLFARHLDISRSGALFGALAYGAMPKLLAHFGAGHITLLYAVPWTPWLLLAEGSGCEAWGRRRFFKPGLVLGVIFLADVRWAVYAGGLWVAWKLFEDLQNNKQGQVEEKGIGLRKAGKSILAAGGQIALAASLASPLAIPLLEFTRLSARSSLAAADSLVFSLPVIRLVGLVFPDFGGLQEWMLYPGVAVLLLALLGLLLGPVSRRSIFWLLVFGSTILISLGENLPGGRWLALVPGFNLLRVPPRASFLALFALAMLAAHGFDRVNTGLSENDRKKAGLFVFAFVIFLGGLASGLILLAGDLPMEFQWWLVILVLSSLWIGLRLHGRVSAHACLPILVALSLFDWGLIHQSNIKILSTEEVNAQGEAVARFIAADQDRYRIYSPSYSVPQHTAARAGLELADGVDPLYMAAYGAYMDLATGVTRSGYSVTIPPYASGDPATDNTHFTPDAERLGWLNVKYIAAAFDQQSPDLILINQIGDTRIYENARYRPRAWIQEIPSPLLETGAGPQPLTAPVADRLANFIEIQSWTPNRIRLAADGPGLLVLSEVAYPGWRVRVDGEPGDRVLVEGLLRGVVLKSSGVHEVIFDFQPFSVYLGIGIQLTTLLGMGWFVFRRIEQPGEISG